MTPSTALRLSKFFGVTPDFWLNLQMRFELFKTQTVEKKDLESIQDYQQIHKIA